jgi:K+-transporting ATPase ATPase C chain
VVTGVAQVAFPDQANGSLVRDAEGKVRGSR